MRPGATGTPLTQPESGRAIKQHSADMTDRLGRVESFRAHVHTVLDAMAPEDTEGIV